MSAKSAFDDFQKTARRVLPALDAEAAILGAQAALRRLAENKSARDVVQANAELERLFARVRAADGVRTHDSGRIESLAVRMRGDRTDAEAARLAGLESDPDLPALTKAARSRRWARARKGDRSYAVELVTEARLLVLLRLRDEVGLVSTGVLPQALAALEKTGEALGEERPHTTLIYQRSVHPTDPSS